MGNRVFPVVGKCWAVGKQRAAVIKTIQKGFPNYIAIFIFIIFLRKRIDNIFSLCYNIVEMFLQR